MKPAVRRCPLCQKPLEFIRDSGVNALTLHGGKTVVVHTRCKRLKRMGKKP